MRGRGSGGAPRDHPPRYHSSFWDAPFLSDDRCDWKALQVFSQDKYDMFAVDSRSEEHTSELQSLMRISYAVFCLKTKNNRQLNKDKETLTYNSKSNMKYKI